MDAEGPNAEQIRYWNEQAGPRWVAFQQALDAQIGALGLAAMDRLDVHAGESVLDVGCGCGSTTLALAARTGPQGHVVGADISAVMLGHARERGAGLGHVTFLQADAQTHPFAPASLDAVFSRFGVMFFVDPTAAFANLRAATRPGGRLGFICWQPLFENPWMLVPMMAAAQQVTLPPPPAPDAPGPFSFGDPERVRGILERAGWSDVALDDHRAILTVGGSGSGGVEAAIDLVHQLGPLAAVLREADDATRVRVNAALREALLPHCDDTGVHLASATWIVTARRPPAP